MDLKYLYTFKSIVDEGNFTKAAKKLNYTQSTITFQIGQLEQELSAQLFEKVGRRMVLTKAGLQLVPYVEEVLASIKKLKQFENDLTECQGDLIIGVAETQLCYKLPNILKQFHELAPKARLFLKSMNCYEIRDGLLNGTLDLGIFYEDVGGFGSRLITNSLGEYPLALVSSPELRSKHSDFISTDQRILVPFIINEKNCIFRQIFERYLSENSIILDHTIELWSIPTIKNLVKSNVGVSFLPKFTVQEELNNGELVELDTRISDSSISAICAHHENKWVSPLMQAFIELCKETN
jgi:DNA-binding transcriptional LysR family regulator